MEEGKILEEKVIKEFPINVQIKKVLKQYEKCEKEEYLIDYGVKGGEPVDLPTKVRMHDGYAIQVLIDEQSPHRALIHTRSCQWVRI